MTDVDQDGTKEFTKKGCSDDNSTAVVRGKRIGFHNWWKEGHPKIRNGYRSGCFTLFIENLPENIYWKRFGSLFCTHGRVIDAFIPNKRNSKGLRFGFIRFATIEEARKEISEMNGSNIDGRKIRVSLAKFKP
ncbi:31 kDa ribonucleoprotein, chloroplastic-like [Hibiscus syriacus]|uniref:31 kDa ribonucleoprotein, chloroplastic-like n=1 Tax=Hibiscus syriacus TaxID=106335 RepID=UPI001921CA46|nr:31 kDa ribonucleoprotein, chloroplastic-like [Hibiscus syriacus]